MSLKAYMASLDIYYLMTEHVFLPVPLRYFFICQTWHPLRLSTCFFSIRFFILEHLQIIGPYGKEENMFNIFIYLTIHIYLTILY